MTLKKCKICLLEKPTTDFWKHKSSFDGLDYRCKVCINKRRRETESIPGRKTIRAKQNKNWRDNNKEYVKAKFAEWKQKNYVHVLKYFKKYNSERTAEQKLIARGNIIKKYWPGSTALEALEKYETLLRQQNYACAICKKPETTFKKSLAVDHNHKTGEARQLLCYRCNRLYVGIHTVETAKAVYEYLLQFIKKEPAS